LTLDILIRSRTLIDGSGAAPRQADVGIAAGVNVLTLVPNGQLRLTVLGLRGRPADSDRLAKMTGAAADFAPVAAQQRQ
jgi:N-acyl-D-aspartate/D-glutamate deacylase